MILALTWTGAHESVDGRELPPRQPDSGRNDGPTSPSPTTLTPTSLCRGCTRSRNRSWSWSARTPWPCSTTASPGRASCSSIRTRSEQVNGLRVAVKAEGQAISADRKPNPFASSVSLSSKAIRGEATPPTDGTEGLRVLRVLRAADRSLTEGRPVMTQETTSGRVSPSATVHPTAHVDQPATIGDGTKIWHFSHVLKGIDDRAQLHDRPECLYRPRRRHRP